MQPMDGVFYVVILIMSVVVHEFAHGYSAYLLGDSTAESQGRLTLNPLKHLDLFGSILLPLLLILSHAGFVVGWARPVPYNPANLRNERKDTRIVALAGILANIALAVIFGLFIRIAPHIGIDFSSPFYKIASIIVITNLVLAMFNLVPIPPLDGSKILFSALPIRLRGLQNFLERWGLFVLLFFIIFLWGEVSPFIFRLFTLLTGLTI